MDRAQVVSQTIATFNTLRDQATELFSENTILSHSELMIEEYFEAKFNPFLRNAKSIIESIPSNDYIVVAIDLWLKNLNAMIQQIDMGTHDLGHAESVYIHQKYLPLLVSFLGNVKLELLETLFNTHEEPENDDTVKTVESHRVLSAKGLASLLAQLINFGIIRSDISPETLAKVLAPIMGCSADDITSNLTYDKENHRFTSKASVQELASLAKLMRSIAARFENQQNTIERG